MPLTLAIEHHQKALCSSASWQIIRSQMTFQDIVNLLGSEAEYLLGHHCQKIPKDLITAPSANHVSQVFNNSNRSDMVIDNLHRLYGAGRLANTGYLSILPIDQGIEHTASYSFYKNPIYFDPENIVRLAMEAGCNGVASTYGVLALMSKYASEIPFIVKINHNELLTYPNKHDQILFTSVNEAHNLGAVGVGATIYFGSQQSNRQIEEISQAFAKAHELGMLTILWCYPRNSAFEKDGVNYEDSADISGQAIHLGVTIGADIIKQKLPSLTDGMRQIGFAKQTDDMYQALLTEHPIDLVRFQVANSYMGKIDLLNSGGGSGEDDLREAVKTAVINKRGGGAGLIMGRKAFCKPMAEGIKIINAVQDVYLSQEIGVG